MWTNQRSSFSNLQLCQKTIAHEPATEIFALYLFTKENYGNYCDFWKSNLSIWEDLVFSQVAEQQTHFE